MYDDIDLEDKDDSKDKRKVEIWALEYDWIFTGKVAQQFVNKLSKF